MAINLPFGITIARDAPRAAIPDVTPAIPKRPEEIGEYDEVGAVGTSYYSGFLDQEEYNPDLRGEKAIEVFTKMRADGMVRGILRALTLPVRATTLQLDPSSDDELDTKIAQVVEKALLNMTGQTWDDFERQALMGGYTYGHAVFEPVYSTPDGEPNYVDVLGDGGKYLVPYKLAPRLQKSIYRWHIDRTGELRGIQQRVFVGTMDPKTEVAAGDTAGGFAYAASGSFHYIDIPVERLFVLSYDREGANYLGESVLRSAYQAWYYKSSFRRLQAIGFERHLAGVPYAITKQGISATEKAELLRTLSSIRTHEKSYALISEAQLANQANVGMHPFGFLEMPTLGSNARAMTEAIQYQDREMALTVIADFLSLGSGLGGNANVMSRDKTSYFFLALQGFAETFLDSLNRQVVRQIVDLNFPGVKQYPKARLMGLEAKDMDRLGRGIAQLIAAGGLTPDAEMENQLRDLFGLPLLPEDAEGKPIRPDPPAPAVVPGAAPAAGQVPPIKVSPSSGGGDYKSYADPTGADAAEALRLKAAQQMRDAADRLADEDDDYDPEEFTSEGHSILKDAFLGAFLLGARSFAGRSPAGVREKAAPWATLTADGQRPYLSSFAGDIATGDLSDAERAARAAQYAGQVWTGFQRGAVSAMGDNPRVIWHAEGDATTCELCADRDGEEYTEADLPGFPGEGDFGDLCEGAANCRCWLEDVGGSGSEELKEKPPAIVAEARCTLLTDRGTPCHRKVGTNVNVGATLYCPRCKDTFDVVA